MSHRGGHHLGQLLLLLLLLLLLPDHGLADTDNHGLSWSHLIDGVVATVQRQWSRSYAGHSHTSGLADDSLLLLKDLPLLLLLLLLLLLYLDYLRLLLLLLLLLLANHLGSYNGIGCRGGRCCCPLLIPLDSIGSVGRHLDWTQWSVIAYTGFGQDGRMLRVPQRRVDQQRLGGGCPLVGNSFDRPESGAELGGPGIVVVLTEQH